MIDDGAMGSLPEPQRDPQLARAIRQVEGGPPSVARLELLRSRIAAAAAAALESRRERAWWEWMTRWARTEVALAAAATILAALIGGASTIGRREIAGDTVIAAMSAGHVRSGAAHLDSLVTHALTADASSEQVMNAIVGPASVDWLFTAALTVEGRGLRVESRE